jgi:succinate-semialdehyde dehydrogenase/glutarate-semialdehyde dehydrogenase
LVSVAGVNKAESHVRDAVAKGAVVTIGGAKAPELGPNFFHPIVLTGLTHDMEIARCETFGPVAALFGFDTEEDVIKMANDSEVGLAGYLYTQDVDRAWRVSNRLDVGMVGVNTGLISDPATPFGGIKESGFGKEGSKYGIEDYTVLKTVTFAQRKL